MSALTKYRCIIVQSTGNFIPYSGLNFIAASDAMETYRDLETVIVERLETDGTWRTVMGVWR